MAILTHELSGLLASVMESIFETFIPVLIALAYSPVNCNSVSVAIMDYAPQDFQFKAHFLRLTGLLPKIVLPLLDREILSFPNRL